jgi:tRNA (mo5U34)-methyltransferase
MEDLQPDIERLAPWFHNLHLPDGTQTHPTHELGDFPTCKWRLIAPHLPADLRGWTVLDVGCNAGFYSFELARRGAAVTAVDCDPHYLRQARWAAGRYGLAGSIEFQQRQVYELVQLRRRWDLVLFLGVIYHLRYPLLGLDIVSRCTERLLVMQSLTMPGLEVEPVPDNLALQEREQLTQPGWPKMAFLERSLAGDHTNWWAPNHACVEAMLRSAGLAIVGRPGHEIYLCRPEPESRMGGWATSEAEYRAVTGMVDGREQP